MTASSIVIGSDKDEERERRDVICCDGVCHCCRCSPSSCSGYKVAPIDIPVGGAIQKSHKLPD